MTDNTDRLKGRQTAFAVLQALIVISTVFAHLVPTATASIVSMVLWLAFGPFFIAEGLAWSLRGIRFALRRPMKPRLGQYPIIVHFAIGWLVGLLVLFVFSVVTSLLGVFSFLLLLTSMLLLYAISFAGNALNLRQMFLPVLGDLRIWVRGNFAILLLTLAAVGLMMFAIRGFSPPPFQFGWDMFQHAYVANIIRDQSIFHPFPSAYSNSFIVDPYTTSFHLLLAMVSFLGNGDVLLIFWIGPLFNLVLFSAGIAFLGRRLGLATVIVLAAVIFGIAFQEWNKGFSLVYLAPASIITALTPTILGVQLSFPRVNRLSDLHIASISVVLLHFLFGLILIIAAYSVPIIRRILTRAEITPRTISMGVLILGGLTLVIPIVAWEAYNAIFRSVSDYLISFENVFWRVSLLWKIDAITRIYYSLPLLGAAIAGGILFETRRLSNQNRGRKPGLGLSFVIFLMFGSLLIYFVEVEQTSRFLFLVRPGLVLLAGIFVVHMATHLPLRRKGIVIAGIATVIVASSLFPLTTFMERQRWDGDTEGNASSFSDYEMGMGRWINGNLPQGAIFISDPRSQSTLLPFAMRESINGHEMPQRLQDLLRSALLSGSADSAYQNMTRILELEGIDLESAYLVVSGRTLYWAQSNLIHIYRPKSITDPTLIDHLRSPLFNMQHSIDNSIFIYSLGSP